MMNVAPRGPQNSYEVVRGFSSAFFSTTAEGAIVEGGGVGGLVWRDVQDASDLSRMSDRGRGTCCRLCPTDILVLSQKTSFSPGLSWTMANPTNHLWRRPGCAWRGEAISISDRLELCLHGSRLSLCVAGVLRPCNSSKHSTAWLRFDSPLCLHLSCPPRLSSRWTVLV